MGFRNPHNLAFTTSGQLIAAGIGNRNVEEVNLVHPGADYGWKEREGSYVYLDHVRGDAGIAALPSNWPYRIAQIVIVLEISRSDLLLRSIEFSIGTEIRMESDRANASFYSTL